MFSYRLFDCAVLYLMISNHYKFGWSFDNFPICISYFFFCAAAAAGKVDVNELEKLVWFGYISLWIIFMAMWPFTKLYHVRNASTSFPPMQRLKFNQIEIPKPLARDPEHWTRDPILNQMTRGFREVQKPDLIQSWLFLLRQLTVSTAQIEFM